MIFETKTTKMDLIIKVYFALIKYVLTIEEKKSAL